MTCWRSTAFSAMSLACLQRASRTKPRKARKNSGNIAKNHSARAPSAACLVRTELLRPTMVQIRARDVLDARYTDLLRPMEKLIAALDRATSSLQPEA
jgi:hypothetical protein